MRLRGKQKPEYITLGYDMSHNNSLRHSPGLMKTVLLIAVLVIVAVIALYYIFIGNIDRSEPEILKLDKPIQIIGLEINTTDKDIYRDVGKVANEFNNIVNRNPVPNKREPWARLNVSKDYNQKTRTFKYIIGDIVTSTEGIPDGLQAYEIPALTFAVFRIKPKSKIAWAITMGRMKRFIYTEWLPRSGHEASDIIGDFELHDDRSLGKNPEIELFVALKEQKDK